MRVAAQLELLAPVEDAWRFATDPHLLAAWWPGVAALVPDRRGLAAGGRWELRRADRPSLLRRPAAEELLLVQAVEQHRLFRFHLTGQRLDCELRLDPAGPARTHAQLVISSAFLVGFQRSLAKVALRRLHSLCQTGAEI